jgi:hypothetical protein
MRTWTRPLVGGLATAALAVAAGCGSSNSASVSLGGGGNVNAGGSVSIPSLPGGIPSLPGGIPGLGSSTTTGPGATSVDACAAMSQSAAAQVSGASSIAKFSGTNVGGVSECVYADTASGAGAVGLIEQVPGGIAVNTYLQAAMAQAAHGGSSGAQSLSGIGDQAIKSVESNGASVAFVKGSTLVVLAVSGSTRTGDAIESDLESLAKQVAGQL